MELDFEKKSMSEVIPKRPILGEIGVKPVGRLATQFNPVGASSIVRVSVWSWVVIDCCLAAASAVVSFNLSPRTIGVASSNTHVGPLVFALLLALTLVVAAQVLGLHNPRRMPSHWELIGKCFGVSLAAVLIVNLETTIFLYDKVGRYISLFSFSLCFAGMVIARYLLKVLTSSRRERLAFVGSSSFSLDTGEHFAQNITNIFEVVPYRNLSKFESVSSWVKKNSIDEIVLENINRDLSEESLLECIGQGVRVTTFPRFVEYYFLSTPNKFIDADWILNSQVIGDRQYYFPVKRGMDIVFSALIFILTLPLLVLAAIAIAFESPGGWLYSQTRVGKYGKNFKIYKIRTMEKNAEKAGAQWATYKDSRVTSVGKILRKTRIDELPQLWNVISGQMSLVGPRPERPEFVEKLVDKVPHYEYRHQIKPGLTGWAQINYPYGASVRDAEKKLSYDLYYLNNLSLALDIQVLLRTVGAVANGSR